MEREDLIQVLKAQQWAKCKGELNALVSLCGSNFTTYSGTEALQGKWVRLKKVIDEFIEVIENEGLDE